jgi:hypothetical protein
MRPRSVPRQSDQVGAVDRRQQACANHAAKTNPKIEPWQATFRILNDSGYITAQCRWKNGCCDNIALLIINDVSHLSPGLFNAL